MRKILLIVFALLSTTIVLAQNGRKKNATPKENAKKEKTEILIKPKVFISDHDNPTDQVIAEDLVVQGSIAVGVDSPPTPSFGFNTMLFTENNLRIHFDDNSSSGSFPYNDWTIEINESANGGTNHFAIVDATATRTPFKILAGARQNALFVDEHGWVGLGTSNPALELQIVDGDTPALRLDQDASGGWGTQVWDIAGNEANFFIRDVTNASNLVFRIKPGAPANSFFMNGDGNIGLGNTDPGEKLDVSGNIKLDSLLKFTPLDSLLGASSEGNIFMDRNTHRLMYYDSTNWITVADEQELSLAGNDLSITGGNSVNLSSFMDNTDEQELNLAGNDLSITGGNMVNLAGYLDNTDEQELALTNSDLSISGGNSISLTSFLDNTDEQELSLIDNDLSITGGNIISLASFLDNTDEQELSLTDNDLSITGGNTISLTSFLDNTDEQELTLSGNNLSISGGNSISLQAYMDNTDQQDLVAATLTGTMLEIEIENGASVTVDLFPLIEDLEARVTAIENELGIGGGKTEKPQLFQNIPNPTDGNTEIPYYIPSSFREATMILYNSQGVKQKEFELTERGRKARVKITDNEFQTGTYYYTLIIDGKKIDAKSMIII